MVELFKTLSEFQAQITVNQSFCLENIEASTFKAAREKLVKWLGEQLYTSLVNAHQNETATPEEANLILYVQRSLANFAMLEYIPQATIHVTDAGITRQENDNFKTAYKYQVAKYIRKLKIAGYFHLEQMLLFLKANSSLYPTWVPNCSREFFINYECDFSKYVRLTEGRWLFDMLFSTMRSVECFLIEPRIGTTLFNEIKNQIASNTLTPANATLVEKLTPAIAHITAHEAAKHNWVRLSPDGLQFVEQEGDDAMKKHRTASDTQASLYLRSHWEHGNRFLEKAIKHIEANLTDYPAYPTKPSEEGCGEHTHEPRCCCGCSPCGCGGHSNKNKHFFYF